MFETLLGASARTAAGPAGLAALLTCLVAPAVATGDSVPCPAARVDPVTVSGTSPRGEPQPSTPRASASTISTPSTVSVSSSGSVSSPVSAPTAPVPPAAPSPPTVPEPPGVPSLPPVPSPRQTSPSPVAPAPKGEPAPSGPPAVPSPHASVSPSAKPTLAPTRLVGRVRRHATSKGVARLARGRFVAATVSPPARVGPWPRAATLERSAAARRVGSPPSLRQTVWRGPARSDGSHGRSSPPVQSEGAPAPVLRRAALGTMVALVCAAFLIGLLFADGLGLGPRHVEWRRRQAHRWRRRWR